MFGLKSFPRPEFSHARYWIILIFGAGILLWPEFLRNFYHSLFLFFIFGLAGIIGETLVSAWWKHFYGQRFWIYREGTLYHKYTSFLNFIPWAIGGFMYLFIIRWGITDVYSFPGMGKTFLILLVLALAGQAAIFRMFFKNRKFHRLTAGNVIFFFAPILMIFIVLWQIYGHQILLLGLSFGIVASILEYLFGKVMEIFLGRKLWTYVYAAADNGHYTPLSFPLFVLAGFYFWMIIRIAGY